MSESRQYEYGYGDAEFDIKHYDWDYAFRWIKANERMCSEAYADGYKAYLDEYLAKE